LKKLTKKELLTLLRIIADDCCPYFHTWFRYGILYNGCMELEKRNLIKRTFEKNDHIVWEPIGK